MKKLLALAASVRFAFGFPSLEKQVDVVAAVLWAEARSEGCDGVEAVAEVIYNRTQLPDKFGASAYDVVTQARQFSCLNHIPAKELVRRAKASVGRDQTMWLYARYVAEDLVRHRFCVGRNVPSAVYFFYGPTVPSWAAGLRFVESIGNHWFYAFYE